MENRAYRNRASGRRGRDRRNVGGDRGFRGASRGGIRGVPIRDRSPQGNRADLEERTLRRRRSVDRMPNVPSAARLSLLSGARIIDRADSNRLDSSMVLGETSVEKIIL